MVHILSRLDMNRALLARQMLLERTDATPLQAMEHLVGMQAQVPADPYVGLWTRLASFGTDDLAELLEQRRAVRATTMLRTTIHLVSASDALALRPALQPVAERAFRSSPFARALGGLPIDEVVAEGRRILAEEPLTMGALGRRLAGRWPDRDPGPLSYSVRYLVPLVQIPPRGLWGRSGQALCALTEQWVGQKPVPGISVDQLVMRYLAAFGPATAADIRTWSWLAGIRAVLERLRPRLRTFRDEAGRELFDVPDGPLPDPATPAPVRFLPEYDNIQLSHADRSRILLAEHRGRPFMKGFILVGGFARATWQVARKHQTATLEVQLYEPIARPDRAELRDEGDRLLTFMHPTASARRLRFA
jgi:hypothetical protein